MKMKGIVVACLSTFILLSACQTNKPSTSQSTKEVAVSENRAAYSKTYRQQTITGGQQTSSSDLVMDDPDRKAAYDTLQAYKKTVKDKTVLNALSIVDEFYISNNTLQATRKAYGVETEEEVYKKLFDYFVKLIDVNPQYQMIFQNKTYKLNEVGPKFLKINVNSLQESAAYEVVFSKFEKDKVYLHIKVPGVDTYQYNVQASYKDNYDSFFLPLEEESLKAYEQKNKEKAILIQWLYYLEAVGGEEGKVDLIGMSWGQTRDIYLVFDTNKDQSISISDEMLGSLSQTSTNDVNKKWEGTFSKWEKDELSE